MARPTADQLKHRCHGKNKDGARCGAPALELGQHCANHATALEKKDQTTTAERLARLTRKALDALEKILDEGTSEAQVKAAKLVLDRTAPASGPHAVAVFVSSPGAVVGDQQTSAADLVRARMMELRSRTREIPSTTTVLDDDVVDAEIVEPEPEAEEHSPQVDNEEPMPPPRGGLRLAPVPPVADGPTVVREQAYGVPRVTSRPADLEQMAWDRGRM